ncbi:Lipid phosphate phosphatase 1 [Hanseniaspora osmophila]|uniref:Lipid phosphate phosphatase 1 n=1 Tax=Hanseniaspora osmophila TaxID=56408 RepID=A0A1E5RH71_9ASCO|nr:Lipid phosphate phosphatase 1 [Hanseniaspora osmophila]
MLALLKTVTQIRVKNFPRWFQFNIVLCLAFAYFAYMEFSGELIPGTSIFTNRNYNLKRIIQITPAIDKPHTDNEFVSGIQCMLFVLCVPPLILLFTHYDDHILPTSTPAVSLSSSSPSFSSSSTSASSQSLSCYNVFNVINSYMLILMVNGLITNILKIIISNPRPDFLARCVPNFSYEQYSKLELEQCTRPLTDLLIIDGLRSTPSGHSSFITCAIVVLFQFLHSAYRPNFKWRNKLKLNFWCIVVVVVVVISRILDNRHHLQDTIFGIVIGGCVGHYGLKWFPRYYDVLKVKYKQELPL